MEASIKVLVSFELAVAERLSVFNSYRLLRDMVEVGIFPVVRYNAVSCSSATTDVDFFFEAKAFVGYK